MVKKGGRKREKKLRNIIEEQVWTSGEADSPVRCAVCPVRCTFSPVRHAAVLSDTQGSLVRHAGKPLPLLLHICAPIIAQLCSDCCTYVLRLWHNCATIIKRVNEWSEREEGWSERKERRSEREKERSVRNEEQSEREGGWSEREGGGSERGGGGSEREGVI